MIECPECGKLCKPLGIKSHIRFAHTEEGKAITKRANAARAGKPAWNTGSNASTDARIAEAAKVISKSMRGRKGTPHTEESKKKISERMKLVGGGLRHGSGRGKKGWYADIWCDSSWELAYVIWCHLHNKNVERNRESFIYSLNGTLHRYYPDFIVDGALIEIKGRRKVDDQCTAKLEACPNITILLAEQMKPILDEIISIHGKDFIKLYE